MRLSRTLVALLTLFIATLTACGGGGGVRQRLFPPTLSVQELAVQADGRWKLKLRMQNFSNVSMRITTVDAQLRVGGDEAGTIALQPGMSVPPESAEVVEFSLQPTAAAAATVKAAIEAGRSVRYAVQGTIHSNEPRSRRDEFTFDNGQLSAVPGLTGVLR